MITTLHGDCRELLQTLPDQSVQTIVTSPPYYGLRDYGTATWEGGDPTCDHRSPTMRHDRNELRPMLAGSAATNAAQLLLAANVATCGKCGARRTDQQIGLEPTPAAYVEALRDVFAECWRVLRDDGTLWLNLGDSYANDTKWGGQTSGKHAGRLHGDTGIGRRRTSTGLRSKNLIGIPWRVAFALQDDGWILRSEIIWHKPNCMPESITDRPTRAHEHLFLFAKEERYYYDQDAVREPQTGNAHSRGNRAMTQYTEAPGGRNRRTVWTISAQSGGEGVHFAVFPERLVEPCILAGSRPGDVVLDPFAGSGTTMRVAERLQRDSIGIDLNADYIELQQRRADGVQVEMLL